MFEGFKLFKKYEIQRKKLEQAESLNKEYVFELNRYADALEKLRKENLELKRGEVNKIDILWEKYLKETY